MHILIAEDDDYKREQLVAVVRGAEPSATFSTARSFRAAVDLLDRERFDLVLLDMTMPTFDPTGPVDIGRYEPFAGVEVLSELDRAGIEVPVIVVTQFERFGSGVDAVTLPELHARLELEFPQSYRGFVYFDSASAEWRSRLAAIVATLTTKRGSS